MRSRAGPGSCLSGSSRRARRIGAAWLRLPSLNRPKFAVSQLPRLRIHSQTLRLIVIGQEVLMRLAAAGRKR